ncbi:MAG: copper chaperone PCu(A)C [Rhizobiales bacterium]|nr:copper chaperone PCu(A)C [Hyphomicrobiales bacterium]
MKTCLLFLRACYVSLLLLPATPSLAGDIMIENAWIREMPSGAEVAAGYLDITNQGSVADRLIGAEASGAMSATLHHMTIDDNGVMRMRPLENLEIAPGETLHMAPGGNHLMIMGVNEPYEAHSDVDIILTFEQAGTITTPFFVGQHARANNDAAHSQSMSHDQNQDQNHNMEQMLENEQMKHGQNHQHNHGANTDD